MIKGEIGKFAKSLACLSDFSLIYMCTQLDSGNLLYAFDSRQLFDECFCL